MRHRVFVSLAAIAAAFPAPAASQLDATASWSVDANGPGRFIAAHGQRAAIMGYPATGLEVWAYPLQLLSGYQVRFRETGRVEPLEGGAMLSRIETSPSEVVRVYNGPDFVVREHVFVPLNAPAAILTYDVEGRPDVEIEARFQPSLDLMWPGALGGQEIAWNDSRSGYVEREPVYGFSAIIHSPETVAHDSTINAATNRPAALSLLMQPRREFDGARRARLVVSQDQADGPNGALAIESRSAEIRAEADVHYASLLDQALKITTPDSDVNRALAASIIAVDQAWVCAPQIGCGNVGGYGPSRPGRRPQYAWFFAGDGLIAVESFLAAGRFERAREELEFIAKYQNKSNGMIWHEMSTSAPLIDWEKRYPYMYVHVDITLQYLSTLADYVRTTGDRAFLKAHWRGVEAAWRYARSLVDPKIGLPTIPRGKEGQNEQAVLRDDVHLSSAWIEAADGFARLARTQGDARLARVGEQAAQAARSAVRDNYWDTANDFWFGGHSLSGIPIREQRPDAADVLTQGAFTNAQVGRALDRLATPEFQTDWGIRSLSASDPDYDPNAYASGAVWGLGSSSVSTIFWTEHRPFTGWSIWHGLVAWETLDSPGHLHEVTAGDFFHPEVESVPEQTWSSAGFLTAAVHGLLGLDVDAATRTVSLAPHLPAAWGEVGIERVRVGSARMNFHVSEDDQAITVLVNNEGPSATIDFNPQMPLGASLAGADVNGVPATAIVTRNPQDQHARIRFLAGTGATRAVVRYLGGVRLEPVEIAPRSGDPSVNLKLASASWTGDDTLKLKAYVFDAAHSTIDVLTRRKITAVEGAGLSQTSGGRYRLSLHVPGQAKAGAASYVPVNVTVKLGPREPLP